MDTASVAGKLWVFNVPHPGTDDDKFRDVCGRSGILSCRLVCVDLSCHGHVRVSKPLTDDLEVDAAVQCDSRVGVPDVM